MNHHRILKKLRTIDHLPTLPTSVMEVNRLLQDEEGPVDRLVAVLEKDQSLALRILKLVNSSFYGLKGRVKNLRHAVTLMGYNTVRNAVVTVAVMDTVVLKHELKGFNINTFWEHAIRVAVMSRHLAVKTRLALVEDAFTAGLLHDIGKVVLVNYFPQELGAVVNEVNTFGLTFSQAETRLDLCHHGFVGSYLAQRWMLPEVLIKTIFHHHDGAETDVSRRELIALVALSNSLVHIMAADPGYHLQLDNSTSKLKDLVTNTFDHRGKWFAEISREMDLACGFFSKG